jgi:hypothetical protein
MEDVGIRVGQIGNIVFSISGNYPIRNIFLERFTGQNSAELIEQTSKHSKIASLNPS